ncbi:hypothetical protein HPB47_021835 [Ixodes persulcatus]|uniref:Uncharacterized protein n=1 Tax=Ixodes persulcatus TaxID=34615 RepID=A0AC60QBR2_IXOPE|nr:hypothetical protein HPB47_021835 [Ixodes persulcatus]
MHPDRDVERRQARIAPLSRSWKSREGTLYVYRAGPVSGIATTALSDAQGRLLRIASIRARSADQAEETAIALAITPGYMGQGGNEAANAAARDALNRDSPLAPEASDYGLPYNKFLKSLLTHCLRGTRNSSRHRQRFPLVTRH